MCGGGNILQYGKTFGRKIHSERRKNAKVKEYLQRLIYFSLTIFFLLPFKREKENDKLLYERRKRIYFECSVSLT